MTTDRGPDDKVLAALEQEIIEGGVFPDDGSALHYWMAATQCAYSLDLAECAAECAAEHPHADAAWAWEHWPVEGADEAEQQLWIDRLGDAGKALLTVLARDLSARGLEHVKLLVFMPCHMGLASVVFHGTDKLPRVYEWGFDA